jgi:hypothetical protein
VTKPLGEIWANLDEIDQTASTTISFDKIKAWWKRESLFNQYLEEPSPVCASTRLLSSLIPPTLRALAGFAFPHSFFSKKVNHLTSACLRIRIGAPFVRPLTSIRLNAGTGIEGEKIFVPYATILKKHAEQ